MPTPFDTPVTTPQPSTFQNLMGAIGVTWGKDQGVAALDTERLEKDRLAKQNAALWGPLYGVVANTMKQNPQWAADKVMLEVIKSPEFENARNSPGFDSQNLSKNLQELVLSAYPQPKKYEVLPQNSTMVDVPQQGSAPGEQPKIVGQGQTETKVMDQYGAPIRTDTNPAQFDPNGLGNNATQGWGYPGSNNTTVSTPQVNWKYNADDVVQVHPKAAPYVPYYKAAAEKWGVPVEMLISQGAKESDGWAEDVVAGSRSSPAGAMGVAQFMPGMPEAWSRKWGTPVFDPLNPEQAIDAQAHVMKDLLQKYQGDYRAALSAYNRGEDKYDRWTAAGRDPNMEPTETRNYVADITGEVPRVQLAAAPGMGMKRRIETIPMRSPTRVELNSILRDEPGLIFAGRGLGPYVLQQFSAMGRAISPDVASELQIANESAKNRLIQLRALLTGAVPPGDTRLGSQVNAYLEMYPEDGVISDPIAAAQKGLDMFDFFSARMYESAEVADPNSGYPVEERKRAATDYRRAARIVNFLGGDRQSLVNTLNDFKQNKKLLDPGLFAKGRDWVKGVAAKVGAEAEAIGENAIPGQGGNVVAPPPNPMVQPTAQPAAATQENVPSATDAKGNKVYYRNGKWGP